MRRPNRGARNFAQLGEAAPMATKAAVHGAVAAALNCRSRRGQVGGALGMRRASSTRNGRLLGKVERDGHKELPFTARHRQAAR
jgi:hypothetical protein